MGMIYLAQPRGNRIRSIDKLKPKDRIKITSIIQQNEVIFWIALGLGYKKDELRWTILGKDK